MSFFAGLFGYVLKFLYNLVNNYGIAIILFSILVKLIMIPMTAKQQKTMKKNEKLQKELKQIQFKYKNDPEKLNQEMMGLYKRMGISPFSGCLSSIVQLILLLSVFLLVRSPLTYMVGLDKDVIDDMATVVEESGVNANNAYKEISIIQYVKNLENPSSVKENEKENTSDVEENGNNENDENDSQTENENKFNIYEYAEQANINMDLFGIDLSKVPTQSLNDWKSLIIPVLYVISSFISIRITTATSKKKEEDKKLITDGTDESEEQYNPMADTGKAMTWMVPIMSISIAIIAPLGLALYWLMNNVLMIIEKLVFNKIFDKEEEAE